MGTKIWLILISPKKKAEKDRKVERLESCEVKVGVKNLKKIVSLSRVSEDTFLKSFKAGQVYLPTYTYPPTTTPRAQIILLLLLLLLLRLLLRLPLLLDFCESKKNVSSSLFSYQSLVKLSSLIHFCKLGCCAKWMWHKSKKVDVG